MKLIKYIIYLSLLVALFFGGLLWVRSYFPLRYEAVIDYCSDKYDLEEELLAGVIFAESKFEPQAHSGKAAGLMQITEETAKWICGELGWEYAEELLYEPEASIKMGSFYLAYLIKQYKSVDTALAAYNAGMGNVTKWLKDKRYSSDGVHLLEIPYGETKRYVQRVKKLKKIYEFIY